MKEDLRVNFVDFWPNFQKKDNYFFHLLTQKYKVIIDEKEPDIVFGSYGFSSIKEIEKYANHRCLKVYYTGESDGPRSQPYDLNITQWRGVNSSNHIRLPLWAVFCSWFDESPISNHRDPSFLFPIRSLIEKKFDIERVYDTKKRVCTFIYADATLERKAWFEKLSSIGRVDSAGPAFNNVGYTLPGRGDQVYKHLFQTDYLFTLAIENKSVDGYLTEKMLHPMTALSIPVYWGDPNSHLDFNERSYINISRFETHDDVVSRVFELANDKNKYLDVLEEKWLNNTNFDFHPDKILSFIERSLLSKV